MDNRLKKAAWEAVRQLKRARLSGHGACHRTLTDGRFRQSIEKLKLCNPFSEGLQSSYQKWLYDLKQLGDFLAVKMYLKNQILVMGSHRFTNLDLALALLDLLHEKDCGLIARAITGSEIIFSAIMLPLEIAAEWSIEDERQLTEEVKWHDRKRLAMGAGGAALLLGVGYLFFKKRNDKPGAK